MQPARVLLLEDDPGVRRFVQMALAGLQVALVPCATLAQARQALSLPGPGGVQLLLMDLTLPDGCALELLHWLHQGGAPPPGALPRAVVFSGGVDAAMQRQLQALGVWRVLHKPAPVGALLACVSEALAGLVPMAAPMAAPAPVLPRPDPVTGFFGGNRALYDAYRLACLAQFPQDLGAGDEAARAGDAQALRRVAHNLKAALTLLGEAPAAQQARRTEGQAEAAALEPMRQGWQQLRALVQALLAAAPGPG